MAIVDAMINYVDGANVSQKKLADDLHFDKSMITKIKNGERKWPEAHDSKLASLNWKLALSIADERTGGYISNILEDIPNLDLHPAAMKELLLKDLHEAQQSLEALMMGRHIPPEKRKEGAEKVWNEVTDVIEKANVLRGVLEEEFGLDRKRLIRQHEQEVKRGER